MPAIFHARRPSVKQKMTSRKLPAGRRRDFLSGDGHARQFSRRDYQLSGFYRATERGTRVAM
jgi:hypothetical protein